ncbi:unnamed protein product [Rhizoctonia solani]|uniref:Uncharacterized protein n=1 Tax=Rhizoctonia solani TaxID=456999 RepID=A0A8H3BTV4_9AGAM|nr:unnamed protein product [Rhizoctonia solani]
MCIQIIEPSKKAQLKYKNEIKTLNNQVVALIDQKDGLIAKAWNQLKVASRAKDRVETLSVKQRKTTKGIEKLTTSLRRQEETLKTAKKGFSTAMVRVNKSKKYWQSCTYATEKSCKQMIVKKLGLKHTGQMKEDSVYAQSMHSLCCQLVMAGVSAKQVPNIIGICAHTFGVDPGPLPDPRSVGWFILEGVAAKIQVGNTLSDTQGITTSMDSTSHCNINFSSMHVMANSAGSHQQLYLAVESTTDHTSQTQVQVLKNTLDNICSTTCHALKCESSSSVMPCSSDLAQKLYRVNGDHASNQLKVAQLEKEWKIDSWVTHLGKSALFSLEESGSRALSDSIYESVKASAGGSGLFSALSTAEQEDSLALELQKCVWDMGNTAFNQSPPILKQDMSCLVHGGCCAHKDMNALKGGSKAMSAFWKANQHLAPPVKLFNKDNDATVTLVGPSIKPSKAEQQAYNMTESGAIKLCSLAGAAYVMYIGILLNSVHIH